MKKFLSLSFLLLILTACGTEKPLTEKEQAAKYGLTVERYREEKVAAARMNMSWEEHSKNLMNEGGMHEM